MPIPMIAALVMILVAGVLLITLLYFSAILIRQSVQVTRRVLKLSSLPAAVKRPIQESRHYADLIKQTVHQAPPGPVRDRLTRTVRPVDEWLVNLDRLEQALNKLYGQRKLSREIRQNSFEVEQLRRQMLTTEPDELESLRSLLRSKEKYGATLQELQTFQHQAEFKIRKIASDLGATHAEMLLLTARGDFNENRFQRLDENLQENLSGLRDIMAAMDDMGYSRATG